MEYTIKKLAQLAGVSTRTLRYYDEINLLKPASLSSSGYRLYGEKEINLLQQILFYKELDLSLETIKSILSNPNFDSKTALIEHQKNLLEKKSRINLLLKNIDKTIKSLEGDFKMSNKEKFEGFKKELLEKNEKNYGKEIREKYGDDVISESYKKFQGLSEEDFNSANKLSEKIQNNLKELLLTKDSSSTLALETAKLHLQWLSFYGNYPPVVHLTLAQSYIDDSRFTKYYDANCGTGAAQLLRDSIANFYNATFDENTWQWRLN